MHDELHFDTSVPFVTLRMEDDIDRRDACELMRMGTFTPGNRGEYPSGEIEFEAEMFVVAAH